MSHDTSGKDAAIHRFFRAVDARDWETVAAGLTDQVQLDYTSLFDGDPEVLSGAEVVARWQGLLPGFDATMHLLGPALHHGETTQCNVRGYHHLDGQTWVVAGWYTLTLNSSERDPLLAGITLDVSYEEGDRGLVERAQARAGA